MLNGEATIDIPGEYHYVGNVKDDVPEGYGTMTFANGKIYKGKFVGGLPHDDNGEMVFSNEGKDLATDKYVGGFKYGEIDGQGVFYFKNNTIYQGEFKNNKRHGKGIFTNKHGTKRKLYYHFDKLVKQIDSDSKNTQISAAKESDLYITAKTEVNNIITAEGEYKYPNGDTYIGTLVNGIPEGRGEKVYFDTKDKYIGNFVAGIESGLGTYYWSREGFCDDYFDSYEGYFIDGAITTGGKYRCFEDAEPQTIYEQEQQYDDLICNVDDTVQFDSKLISNSQAPKHIIEKFKLWVENVNRDGIIKVRQSRGMHDEALKGVLKGYRSARLSSDYRV
ncbi:MAG: hypothetical protein ACK5Z5_05875, partial [Neisseriaceae bacterium]